MKTLVTVCARGGSKGVKNKNLVPIGGKPLIAWTVEQARRWGKANRIVCSTDSDQIAEAARAAGAEAPFTRPAELSGDTVGKVAVIRHALAQAESTGEVYDLVVDLDVTSPIRTVADLDGCLARFCETNPEVLFSVTPARKNPYFNMLERRADGRVVPVKTLDAPVLRRQDAPAIYDMNASIYFYEASALRRPDFQSVLRARFEIYEMPEESAFDIDSPLDLHIVEAVMRMKGWI